MPRARTCARKWRAARAECFPVTVEEAIEVLLSFHARAPLTRSWHAACTDCAIVALPPVYTHTHTHIYTYTKKHIYRLNRLHHLPVPARLKSAGADEAAESFGEAGTQDVI